MAFRTKNTYTVPGVGTTHRGKSGAAKTFTGRGPPPAGTKKTPEPTIETVPVTTVSPTGVVTATVPSPTRRQRRAAHRRGETKREARARRILHRVERTQQAVKSERAKTQTTVRDRFASKPPQPKKQYAGAFPSPVSKPRLFSGLPTAGKPKLRDLQRAKRAGKLDVNKRGFVTTPEVRVAAKELKAAKRKYRKSGPNVKRLAGEFPELTPAKVSALGAAQRKTGTPAALLAGILSQESDFGRSTLPGVHSGQNEAGAAGPYQIGTGGGAAGDWWHEHQPANKNPYSFRDASQAAGQYLAEAGATKDPATWYDAALSYNHAGWYAEDVEREAKARAGLTKAGKPGNPKVAKQLQAAKATASKVGLPVSEKAAKQSYLKTFGKQIGQQLKLVSKSKGFHDDSATSPITIQGRSGGTLVRNVQGSSGVASVIDKGHGPEIAARLLLLSKKTGKTIYVLSGYRTDAQSAAVGGSAGDPHSTGEAFDIGVDGATIDSANGISEADYESVGLYRPYGTGQGGSSAEDNHVQLLNGGTPATGGGSTSTSGGSVGTVGAVPTGGTAAPSTATTSAAKAKKAPGQSAQQTLKRLEALGVGVGPGREQAEPTRSGSTTKHRVLDELERKYASR